jgi:hypothetical protein
MPDAAFVDKWACGGLARLGMKLTGWAADASEPSMLPRVGTLPLNDAGETFLAAALGQPQTCCWLWRPVLSPEYSGRARLACVARQLRIVKGESMEISK